RDRNVTGVQTCALPISAPGQGVPPGRASSSAQADSASQAPAPVRVSARGETIAGQTTTAMPRIVTPGDRGPRPEVDPGRPISGYSDDQLDALVSWLGSDGRPRSLEQDIVELRSELGLSRQSA